jgi:hypothetical protein
MHEDLVQNNMLRTEIQTVARTLPRSVGSTFTEVFVRLFDPARRSLHVVCQGGEINQEAVGTGMKSK